MISDILTYMMGSFYGFNLCTVFLISKHIIIILMNWNIDLYKALRVHFFLDFELQIKLCLKLYFYYNRQRPNRITKFKILKFDMLENIIMMLLKIMRYFGGVASDT